MRGRIGLFKWVVGSVGLLASIAGCGAKPGMPIRFGANAAPTAIVGLGPCTLGGDNEARLDPDRPLTILVHGCNASGGRFGALAEVFALHEQQTLCFRYDDRARITRVARDLRDALDEVGKHLRHPQLTVLGHSQGGLVARTALSEGVVTEGMVTDRRVRLVTVSSPFAGIRAASHCGSMAMRVWSLGTSLAVCRTVAGAKWRDIHYNAALVRQPRNLAPFVEQHVEVITNEADTCRTRAADGTCLHDDFVFSIAEQQNPRVEADRRVASEVIAAGHTEIVGSDSVEPQKLVEVLQEAGVLLPTPQEKRAALRALFERLF